MKKIANILICLFLLAFLVASLDVGKPSNRIMTLEERMSQAQTVLMEIPWKAVGKEQEWKKMPSDFVRGKTTGQWDSATEQAVLLLQIVAQETNLEEISVGVSQILDPNIRANINALTEAAEHLEQGRLQLKYLFTDLDASGSWDVAKIKKSLRSNTYFPYYFPKPWHRQIGRDLAYNTPCNPWDPVSERDPAVYCVESRLTHFLSWGKECIRCGASLYDPREERIKMKYPEYFTAEALRDAILQQKPSFFIPSPGMRPYIEPPTSDYYYPKGDPDPIKYGFRFLDAEDRDLYYEYLDKYNEFFHQETKYDRTRERLTKFLTMFNKPIEFETHIH